MKAAFHSGASGLLAYQEAMNTIGNNLSNVNTPGYKKQGVSFEDLLHNQMWVNVDPKPLTGHGTRVVDTGIQTTAAALMPSSYEYSFAITAKNNQFGMFAVENADGTVSYTRNGSFTMDVESEELVTLDGRFVLDSEGDHISIDQSYRDSDFDPAKDEMQDLTQEIGVYIFPNPQALTPVSSTYYQPNDASGEAESLDLDDGSYKILKGYLEASGVDMSDAMSDMIIAQRAYQMSARVVQTSDEMEQVINSLRS